MGEFTGSNLGVVACNRGELGVGCMACAGHRLVLQGMAEEELLFHSKKKILKTFSFLSLKMSFTSFYFPSIKRKEFLLSFYSILSLKMLLKPPIYYPFFSLQNFLQDNFYLVPFLSLEFSLKYFLSFSH